MRRNEVEETIHAFAKLGEKILIDTEARRQVFKIAQRKNPWFEEREVLRMLHAISESYLDETKLFSWIERYPEISNAHAQNIGLIAAANIPLVSFHDLLCILISGSNVLLRCSDRDTVLYEWIIGMLNDINPKMGTRIRMVDKLTDFEAIIATGSDHSYTYFKKYFSRVPHLLRGHRNSIAWISGLEDEKALIQLGEDIYSYFGLGCRNVSLLFIPREYDLAPLLRIWDENFQYLRDSNRYNNNYEYRLAISMLNGLKFHQSETLLLIESNAIASHLSTLHYQFYDDKQQIERFCVDHRDKIQCIVGPSSLTNQTCARFGSSQKPELEDYADGTDTMKFLLSLNY
jgi:hypothetical protein